MFYNHVSLNYRVTQCSESPYSHKQVLPRLYLTMYLDKAIKVSSVSLSKLSPSIHSC